MLALCQGCQAVEGILSNGLFQVLQVLIIFLFFSSIGLRTGHGPGNRTGARPPNRSASCGFGRVASENQRPYQTTDAARHGTGRSHAG